MKHELVDRRSSFCSPQLRGVVVSTLWEPNNLRQSCNKIALILPLKVGAEPLFEQVCCTSL